MLTIESSGPKLTITLNRPEVRNAFNDELILQLTHAFADLAPETRVITLRGEGKSFCAGGDLDWMRRAANYSEHENYRDAMRLGGLFEAIAECKAMVIAQVHGAAFGGGCGLVAASDIAIASPETKFAFSEVRLGLVPGTISGFVIPKIGAGHARALFTTGEAFGAEHALRIGLIHEIADDLNAAAEAKIASILSVGPKAAYEAKRLALEHPLSMEECAQRLARARAGEEGKEGVAAFLEKRPASFVVGS